MNYFLVLTCLVFYLLSLKVLTQDGHEIRYICDLDNFFFYVLIEMVQKVPFIL